MRTGVVPYYYAGGSPSTPYEIAADSRSRAPPVVPQAPARLVPPPRTRPALAAHPRSLPRPRVGGHAAADAGRSRPAQVRGVAVTVPELRGAGRGRGTRGDEYLVPARLQHPPQAPSGDRARVGRALRRHAAGRR